MEWPESRQLAALYQSPGPAGIGFARYASSGTVTPELWANISETEARGLSSDPGTEEWSADMKRLRELLEEEGITEPEKEEDRRANRAAAALQAHVDEVNGMPGGSYGDEGSDTFVEAVVELLVDLKHLLWRADDRLMLEDLAQEAIDRWGAEDDEEEDDDDGPAMDGDLIGPLVAVDEAGNVSEVFTEEEDDDDGREPEGP